MEYLSVSDFEGKSTVFKEIINFKDVLEEGIRKGVFVGELTWLEVTLS